MFGFRKKERKSITHISNVRNIGVDEISKYPLFKRSRDADTSRIGSQAWEWSLPNALSTRKKFQRWLEGNDDSDISDDPEKEDVMRPRFIGVVRTNLLDPLNHLQFNDYRIQKFLRDSAIQPDQIHSHISKNSHHIDKDGVLLLHPKHPELQNPSRMHPVYKQMMNGNIAYLQPGEMMSERLLDELTWISQNKPDVLEMRRRIHQLLQIIASGEASTDEIREFSELKQKQTTFEKILENRRIALVQAIPGNMIDLYSNNARTRIEPLDIEAASLVY
jgi:hypothetical protein